MAGDLNELMARAAHDIETATAPVPTDALGHVRSTVRRRRVRRHAVESFGAMAVVGAVAAAFLVGRPALQPADPTPSPSATVPADATPTPTPTPTPTGPPVREDGIDDATALARLSAPRTGEVWVEPARVEAPVAVSGTEPRDWYLVGNRGEARIYAVTDGSTDGDELDVLLGGLDVSLYELEGDTLRHVACPSARTGDACGAPVDGVPAESDDATFYDTLTPPRTITLPDGYVLRTGVTWATEGAATGSMLASHHGSEVRVHADLGGGVQVVEVVRGTTRADHPLPGVRNVTFGLRLPYGAIVDLLPADVPGGDSAAITWDDGVSRDGDDAGSSRTWPAAGLACDGPGFTVQPDGVDRSAWVAAGTADGMPVYVPATGRLELATKVFTWHRDSSYGMTADGEFTNGADAYRIRSVADLVADNALFAFEGPGGQWVLGLRGDAVNTAYECV